MVHPRQENFRGASRQRDDRSDRSRHPVDRRGLAPYAMAGTFKARHRMSYADCFAAALAKHRKSDLVTGDKEFKQVEGEVSIRWL
ncbi:MAG: PIN domain-containing protein [Betaproteobacteria bacterium]|nr:PIN domain-containing protein [Betaproteobacteria bacterium]